MLLHREGICLRWSRAATTLHLQLPQKLPQSPKTQEANRFGLDFS